MLRRRSLGSYVYTVYEKVSYSGGIICHKIYQVNSDSSNAIVEWMSTVCYVWKKNTPFFIRLTIQVIRQTKTECQLLQMSTDCLAPVVCYYP